MTSRISKLLPLVKAEWKQHGVAPRPGASGVEIAAFERAHGILLSVDVADYFRAVDGMNETEADQFGICFWSLKKMRAAREEIPAAHAAAFESYFVFADYSLWAHGYAVRLGEAGDDVIIVGDESPVSIAPSFAAFFELYLQQPDRLFPAREGR
jgi:hypothetical protein